MSMHYKEAENAIKQGINVQNLRQSREYYMSAMSFWCGIGDNETGRFVCWCLLMSCIPV